MSKVIKLAIALMLFAGGWFLYNGSVNHRNSSNPDSESRTNNGTEPENKNAESKSAFSVVDEPTVNPTTNVAQSAEPAPETQHENTSSTTDNPASSAGNQVSASGSTDVNNGSSLPPSAYLAQFGDATEIGYEPISDDDFSRLSARIRSNPEFLDDLLYEYRINTDFDRAKRLAALLGQFNNSEIIDAANELVYSGHPDSQRAGLELLARMQPHNSDARDTAIGLLSTETDRQLLVSTLNVLATPAKQASLQQRQLLLDNLELLSGHDDPVVRSHSLDLAARWSNGANSSNSLTRALTDQNPQVRATAAASLVETSNKSAQTKLALLTMAEDPTEVKVNRQTALYALQKSQLNTAEQARYERAREQVKQIKN